MSDVRPIKQIIKPVATRPLNKDSAKKENRKDNKEEQALEKEEELAEGHVNEYI